MVNNTASFGAYTELVEMRTRLEGRLGKWPALAVAAVRVLRHSEPAEAQGFAQARLGYGASQGVYA